LRTRLARSFGPGDRGDYTGEKSIISMWERVVLWFVLVCPPHSTKRCHAHTPIPCWRWSECSHIHMCCVL
jgi:hypothetical protein